jgi:uncharacterized membrane protein YoaT (DUF817 family)
VAAGAYEFLCFGFKQAAACLFGGLMVALLLASWRWYPRHAWLARYDFLTLAALAIQGILLAMKLESREEARVILLFHVVGTAMELFKTAVGSWTYPEPSLLRLGGVPLFTGFMYAAVGSYIARAWRLFDFRFTRHPPFGATVALAAAIYLNFFTHHYLPDARPLLFAAVAWLFGRAGSTSASAACTGACRCCWVSCWWRCSSGWRRTWAPSAMPGCTRRSGVAGTWCRSASWGRGCCC